MGDWVEYEDVKYRIAGLEKEIENLTDIIKEAHSNIATGSGYIVNGYVDCICRICREG